MPGICGVVYTLHPQHSISSELERMLRPMTYGRCAAPWCYSEASIGVGCVTLSSVRVGHRDIHETDAEVVIVYGTVYCSLGDVPPGPLSPQTVATLHRDLGEKLWRSLSGTFLVLIWDKLWQRLTLANDPLGLEPLALLVRPDQLAFASEVKALLQLDKCKRRLDLATVADYFQFGKILGDRTFFTDISLLSPATYLVYEGGRVTRERYWDFSYPDVYPVQSKGHYEDLIVDAVSGAVRRSQLPDESYGSSLSGGLDSRWIIACLAEQKADVKAYTYSKETSNDLILGREVARRVGVPHQRLPVPDNYLAEQLSDIVYVTDGMYSAIHAHVFPSAWSLSRDMNVMMSGFSGDLIFGSRVFRGMMERSDKAKDQAVEFIWRRTLAAWLPSELMQALFGARVYDMMRESARGSLVDSMGGGISDYPANLLEYQFFRNELRRHTYVSELLKEPFIENRCPFADMQVLKIGLELPPWERFHEQAYARAFSRRFPDLASIPWEKTGLPVSTPLLPVLLHSRFRELMLCVEQKIRGPVDRTRDRYASYGTWIRGSLREFVYRMLLGPDSNSVGLFQRPGIEQVLDLHMSGKADLREFISLMLTFEAWSRLFYRSVVAVPPGSLVSINEEIFS